MEITEDEIPEKPVEVEFRKTDQPDVSKVDENSRYLDLISYTNKRNDPPIAPPPPPPPPTTTTAKND
jgi:hypothetical protein